MSNHYEQNEQDLPQENKTVWDAVNYFEGKAPSLIGDWLINCNGNQWSYSTSEGSQSRLVCTIKEFKQCVEDISKHIGSLHFFQYEQSEKQPLTRENSDYSHYEQPKLRLDLFFGLGFKMDKLTSKDIKWEDNAEAATVLKRGNIVDVQWLCVEHARGSATAFHYVVIREETKDQLKYTAEIALTHNKPEIDMLCRIEHDAPLIGLTVDEFTLKFETDKEYSGLDKDGYCLAISKDAFIAFHAFHEVDGRGEMQIAQEKQIDDCCSYLIDEGVLLDPIALKLLQKNGMLSETLLPLEK